MTTESVHRDAEDITKLYESSGGFSGRMGLGNTPAVLVIDVVNGFTEIGSALHINMDVEIAAIDTVLNAARARSIPVYFFTVAYADISEAGVWIMKIPASDTLRVGSHEVEVDHRLNVHDGEATIVKKFSSGFHGTDLLNRLIAQGIDSLIVTGCSTSGCVRATVVDACSYGFRTIVVSDAVADRHALSHEVSLAEMDTRYADVMSSAELVQLLAARR